MGVGVCVCVCVCVGVWGCVGVCVCVRVCVCFARNKNLYYREPYHRTQGMRTLTFDDVTSGDVIVDYNDKLVGNSNVTSGYHIKAVGNLSRFFFWSSFFVSAGPKMFASVFV